MGTSNLWPVGQHRELSEACDWWLKLGVEGCLVGQSP